MQRAPPWLAGGSALSWLCRGSRRAAADANSCVYIPLKEFLGTNNAWYGGRGRKTKPREEEGPSCQMVSDFTSLSAQIASSDFSMGPREMRVAFSLLYLRYNITVLVLELNESCGFPRICSCTYNTQQGRWANRHWTALPGLACLHLLQNNT